MLLWIGFDLRSSGSGSGVAAAWPDYYRRK
jgi:hypothetical protein